MSFYRRYELSRLIRDDEAKTFAGVQRDTGRQVFLHLLSGDLAKAETSGLGDLIRRAERTGAILDSGEFAATKYYVTARTEPFDGFRAWLQSLPAGADASPPPSVAAVEPVRQPPRTSAPPPAGRPPKPDTGEFIRMKAPEPEHEPGAFTRLFEAPQAAPQTARPAPPPAPAPPASPPSQTPGEFTSLFGSPRPAAPPRPAQPTGDFSSVFGGAGKPSVPPPPGPTPGEFTSFFGGAAKPLPPPPESAGDFTSAFAAGETPLKPSPEPPAADPEVDEFDRAFRQAAPLPPKREQPVRDDEPFWPDYASAPPKGKDAGPGRDGEFTRFFGNPIPGEQIDIAAEQAKNAGVRDDPTPFQPAGGFTRVFGPAPGAQAPVPPPPPRDRDSLSASQIFSRDEVIARQDQARRSAAEKAVQRTMDAEPGEYTRMISSGAVDPSIPAPPTTTPAGPARPMAPPSQVIPSIVAAPSTGTKLLKIVVIVLGTAAGMAALFAIIYVVMSRFAPAH